MTRILMADDHAVVCTGVRLILEAAGGFILKGEVRNGDDLLGKLASDPEGFDMIILDISMPGRESIEVLREIKILYPSIPVAVFTMNSEEPYALRFFRQGASAYIKKDSQPEEIVRVLRIVAGGRKYFNARQVEMMADYINEVQDDKKSSFGTLTDRELQVLHQLATGRMKGEIADKLAVSKHTISNHRNNILKKLQLRNNSELTRYAIQNGLIS
jgi:DNA-binding NarL/FixJ family response regulator